MNQAPSEGWFWLPGIVRRPSPNFNTRPDQTKIDLLVIHNISLPPGEFGTGYASDLLSDELNVTAHPWFQENLEDVHVSAHFLIERDGTTTQFVSCNDRAWHAGLSTFKGRENCNDFSIGIELEGTDEMPYTDVQYDTLAALTHQLRQHYPLTNVRGHCHIAPTRKTDPGSSFDWVRYAKLGNWQSHQLPNNLTV